MMEGKLDYFVGFFFFFLALHATKPGLPQWLSGKESTSSAGAAGDAGLIPGSGRSPGRGP